MAGICEYGNELSGSIKCTNIYRSMQTISNIPCMQNNLNADKSDMSANMNGKGHFGRPRCQREDVIKLQLKETGYKSVVWINLTQHGPVAHFWEYGNES